MKAPSTAAFAVVRFVVVDGGLEPRQFRSMQEALREAGVAVRRTGYAAVYRVTGEIVTDLWRPPVLLWERGRRPSWLSVS